MNERIEKAYEQRPRGWIFELAVAAMVLALLVWSGSGVETSGTTQSGGKIAIEYPVRDISPGYEVAV